LRVEATSRALFVACPVFESFGSNPGHETYRLGVRLQQEIFRVRSRRGREFWRYSPQLVEAIWPYVSTRRSETNWEKQVGRQPRKTTGQSQLKVDRALLLRHTTYRSEYSIPNSPEIIRLTV
jgi:hypothetical protein